MLNVDQNRIKDALVTKTSNAVMQRYEKAQYSKQLSDYNADITEEKNLLQSLPHDIQFAITNSVVQDLIGQRNIFAVIMLITSFNDVIKGLFESYSSKNANNHAPPVAPPYGKDPFDAGGEAAYRPHTNPPGPPPIQHNGTNVPRNMPFTYETGSRILSDVMFFDPFRQFTSEHEAILWAIEFNSIVSQIQPTETELTAAYSRAYWDHESRVHEYRPMGRIQMMLQSPNLWAGQATNSFNSIVTGWSSDTGFGGTLLRNMNLTGKGIDVPTVIITDNEGSAVVSTPRWDIVGSNAKTALGNIADLGNLAIVPRSRYSEFTVTSTTTNETKTLLEPGGTIDDMYKATGGYPASIHIHNGKIFALFVMEHESVGVMLHPSYILDGSVFVDKYNATIRKLTYEGHTYDIIKVDVNHWRLEPENIEFTELAAITLQNEIPSLGNPVVWRKDPVTGIWHEVYAQFNENGEAIIANTSTSHFSDWAINKSNIVFKVNGVDIIESDGIREYPSDPLRYSITVNNPSTAIVEVFAKSTNTDDYIVSCSQLIDDEDDPGSKLITITHDFNQTKYDQYRYDAEAPLRDALYNCRYPNTYIAEYTQAIRGATSDILSEFADRVSDNFRSTINLIAYMQFLNYFIVNKSNINEKAQKYIYDEAMQPYFVGYIQDDIDNGMNSANISLTSSYNIINNIDTVLDKAVNIQCDAQPTQAKRESIRNEIVEYYTLLYPIRQKVYDKYVLIADKFSEARRLSYSSAPVETTRLVPYFQQHSEILTDILTTLQDILLITATFVDTFIAKYLPDATKEIYHDYLVKSLDTSVYDATEKFTRSGVNSDIARNTFEIFVAAAVESAILDANPFFSIERRYEEERLTYAANGLRRKLQIKIAARPAFVDAALNEAEAAEAAEAEASRAVDTAEYEVMNAAGLRGQLNFNPGNGAGDANYNAAVNAQDIARGNFEHASNFRSDINRKKDVILDAYTNTMPSDVGVNAATLLTIAKLESDAEETWARAKAVADDNLRSYNDAQQATVLANAIPLTEADVTNIAAATAAIEIATVACNDAGKAWYDVESSVPDIYRAWRISGTDESKTQYDNVMQLVSEARFIREQKAADLRNAEAAVKTVAYNTAHGFAVHHAKEAEAAALEVYNIATGNVLYLKKLFDAAKLRHQRVAIMASN